MWDPDSPEVVSFGRKDLNGPHTAVMWDFDGHHLLCSRCRKDLNEPPTPRWWDSPTVQHLHCRKDLKPSTHCREWDFSDSAWSVPGRKDLTNSLTACGWDFRFCAKLLAVKCESFDR